MTKVSHDRPCCGSAGEFDEPGCFEICQTCWWEDDPLQEKNPDLSGGANRLSLKQAKEHFRKTGCSDPQLTRKKTIFQG